MQTIGETLKQERLKQKKKLVDAASFLHIKKQHLQMLELDEFESLNKETYIVGCLKSYAVWLGMETAPLVQRLKDEYGLPYSTQKRLSSVRAVTPVTSNVIAAPSKFMVLASVVLMVCVWIFYALYHASEVELLNSPVDRVVEKEKEKTTGTTDIAAVDYVLVAMGDVALEFLDTAHNVVSTRQLSSGDTVFLNQVEDNVVVRTAQPELVEVFLNNTNSDYVGGLKDTEFFVGPMVKTN